jgi:hypothetical protein
VDFFSDSESILSVDFAHVLFFVRYRFVPVNEYTCMHAYNVCVRVIYLHVCTLRQAREVSYIHIHVHTHTHT